MSESIVIAALIVAGGLILTGLGARGWSVAPLSLVLGAFGAVLIGALLAVTGTTTKPHWIVGLLLLIAVAVFVYGWRRGVDVAGTWRPIASALAVALLLVVVLREANLVKYHIDSFRYLVMSGLLAEDLFDLAGGNLLEKRLMAAPILHSLAHLDGEWYLRSVTPLLSLSLAAWLPWVLRTRFAWVPARSVGLVAGAALVLLVSNNRYVWHSFYLNDHLFFGIAFFVAAASAWLVGAGTTPSDQRPPLLVMLAVSAATLVVTRPEGFIAAALVLVPFALDPRVPARHRTVVAGSYGYAVVMWFGYVAMSTRGGDGSFRISSAGPALFGILLLLGMLPVLRSSWLLDRRRALLMTAELSLWAALLLLTVRDTSILRRSLGATFRNVVLGAGHWGWALITLGVLGLLVLLTVRSERLTALRFPLTTMVPVFLLLAYLRDGAYRVGSGDSLNRMLIQIVPLLVLYVAAGALMNDDGDRPTSDASLADTAPAR